MVILLPKPLIRWASTSVRCHVRRRSIPCEAVFAPCCCGGQDSSAHKATDSTCQLGTILCQKSLSTVGRSRAQACLSTKADTLESAAAAPELVDLDDAQGRVKGQPFFSGLNLDTAAHLRKNEGELQRLLHSTSAKLVPWYQEHVLVQNCQQKGQCQPTLESRLTADESMPHLSPVLLAPASQFLTSVEPFVGTIFMGLELDTGDPIFAGILKQEDVESVSQQEDWKWEKLRAVGPKMSAADAGLLAMAHGLLVWHMDYLHCGRTGKPTEPTQGGHARITTDSSKNDVRPTIRFPRIDPAVIVLVTSGEYCLLGRKPQWTPNRYSLLSGFLEVGETLERAAEREVLEESSVQVDPATMTYEGSQPWPFPRSLMVGFRAQVRQAHNQGALLQGIPYHFSGHLDPGGDGFDRLKGVARSAAIDSGITQGEIDTYLGTWLPKSVPQEAEMDRVVWFHRDFLRKLAVSEPRPEKENEVSLPGNHSVGRQILKKWTMESVSGEMWDGECIDDVRIDSGRFKYLLIRVRDRNERSKIILRGNRAAKYHMNLLEAVKIEHRHLDLEFEPVGGGRIDHCPTKGTISMYGYSSAFGQAVHDVAAVLCHRWFPLYDPNRLSVSYDGYCFPSNQR